MIQEHGFEYSVDVENGQKTGFYLDQRANRAKIQEISTNKEILNCFCYTGGFTLNALRGGAKFVTSIDSSEQALQMAKLNVETNELPAEKTEWIAADVFKSLRKFRDQGRNFDIRAHSLTKIMKNSKMSGLILKLFMSIRNVYSRNFCIFINKSLHIINTWYLPSTESWVEDLPS